MKKIEIYSDGWARPNPGPWWYGIILRFWKDEKQFSGFESHTTNNRMELTWVIVWLSKLKEKCDVQVFTDSSYVINWIEKWWAENWKKNNWKKADKKTAENYDLWEKLLIEIEKHKVKFNWVRWHNWHQENERCDELATGEILRNVTPHPNPLLKESPHSNTLLKESEQGQNNKTKIKKAWDKCRKCWTPVVKAIPKKKNTKNKSYYYEYFLTCPECKTNYFVDEAKVMINKLDL